GGPEARPRPAPGRPRRVHRRASPQGPPPESPDQAGSGVGLRARRREAASLGAMNILIIGDVVGNPGRGIMKKALPGVFRKYDVDYCIANLENAAGGFGVTREICDEILAMGVDCMTSGNHIWDKREILPVVDQIPQLLRPLNYPAAQPGRGSHVGRAKDSRVPVATLNLSGRVFMNGAMDDPFTRGMAEVARLRKETPVII